MRHSVMRAAAQAMVRLTRRAACAQRVQGYGRASGLLAESGEGQLSLNVLRWRQREAAKGEELFPHVDVARAAAEPRVPRIA